MMMMMAHYDKKFHLIINRMLIRVGFAIFIHFEFVVPLKSFVFFSECLRIVRFFWLPAYLIFFYWTEWTILLHFSINFILESEKKVQMLFSYKLQILFLSSNSNCVRDNSWQMCEWSPKNIVMACVLCPYGKSVSFVF